MTPVADVSALDDLIPERVRTMPSQQVRIGLQGRLYINTGTFAIPVWVEIVHRKDVVFNMGWTEVDATDASMLFEAMEKGQIQATVDFGYIEQHGATGGDTVAATLKAAMLSRDPSEFALMDGSIGTSGEKGWRITGHLLKGDRPRGNTDPMRLDFSIKPAPNEDGNPQEYTVP